MPSEISPEEASALLADIESARTAMRHAVREHRGHYYLWIWGAAWIAMPLTAQFGGDAAARFFPLLCIPPAVLSFFVGFSQSRQIRRPANTRFITAMLMIWAFAAMFPFVLRVSFEDARSLYAYCCLVAMLTYVIAGLWTDTYLLWVGLAVAVLVLTGLFLLPGIFWLWMAIFGGGTLVLTGFYVRHFWR